MSEPDVRFEFGRNWSMFSSFVNEERITHAVECLKALAGDLRGKTFLDAGCGSGLHSLAAIRAGAARVHSFDYDQESVACTQALKAQWAPDANWTIEQGSALDEQYLRSLGGFDVLYSWGVLHHTGDMWKALDLIGIPARSRLVVSLYNDQGMPSRFWKRLKRTYVRSGLVRRKIIESYVFFWMWGVRRFLVNPVCARRLWRDYSAQRGMSPWHDVVDWAGGYPFEVARPEHVTSFFSARNWKLENIIRCRPRASGCNEFVFVRELKSS